MVSADPAQELIVEGLSPQGKAIDADPAKRRERLARHFARIRFDGDFPTGEIRETEEAAQGAQDRSKAVRGPKPRGPSPEVDRYDIGRSLFGDEPGPTRLQLRDNPGGVALVRYRASHINCEVAIWAKLATERKVNVDT
jgi:hypothetical protein